MVSLYIHVQGGISVMFCGALYRPVCDMTGQTYSNTCCSLLCAGNITDDRYQSRGSGQHTGWTGRLPVQSCLAQLATTFCCNVRVIDPTWSLPPVSTVITTFMLLILQIVGSLQACRAWPTSRCSCPWSWRSLLPVQVSLVPSSLFST